MSALFKPVPENAKFVHLVFEKRKDSIISRIIRFFTHSDYCHVELWEVDSGVTLGAKPWKGVVTGTLSDFKNPAIAKIEYAMDSTRYFNLFQDSLKYVGCKYDYKGVLGFLINKFKRRPRRYKCSHLVDHILKDHGIILTKKDSIKVTPQDLAESVLVTFVGSDN